MSELQVTELGEERRCTRCLEWWPNDDEFFSRWDKRGFCRACAHEQPRMTEDQRQRSNAKKRAERLDPARAAVIHARDRASYARRKAARAA